MSRAITRSPAFRLRTWPWTFLCRTCRAYVRLHPFTHIPLGTLADAPTREARKRAKAEFNPIWQSGAMTRIAAYVWLAQRLGIENHEECHIDRFDIETCDRVVAAIREKKHQ
ncbi:zinc-finger-containing protein [Burkholderia mayonis]|uniref:zinc-finger-containing protein n=1 Tax=Burkholderia mayonis TaxID=1385591 RepID=UPI0009E73DF0|nr:zinc-finger-containing protein [Burkholderia mayonis]